jgi:hypothetical protein
MVLTILVVLLASSCTNPHPVGSSASASAGGTGIATASDRAGAPAALPSGAGNVVAGLASHGHIVVVHVGQRLLVRLAINWTAPEITLADADPTRSVQPLRMDSARGFPTPGPAMASFTAVRTGTTVVSARYDYACSHASEACRIQTRLFSIIVRVEQP